MPRQSTCRPAIAEVGSASSQEPGPPIRSRVAVADAVRAAADSSTPRPPPVEPEVTTTRSAPSSSGSSGWSTVRAASTAAAGPAGRTASGAPPARQARTAGSTVARIALSERPGAGTGVSCRATDGKPTLLIGGAAERSRLTDVIAPAAGPALPAQVYRVPMRTRFRGIEVRDGVLVRGPAGWGEFSPFWDYDVTESRRWWAAAREAAVDGWPAPVRTVVPVNVTVPAVGPETAHAIVRASGCRTAKVKVAEPGQTPADDLARVEAVRDALGPAGAIRVDANAAWDVDTAVARIKELDRVGLEYVEQPCATLADLVALRRRIDVRLAADEVVRRAADPLGVDLSEACDVVVLKVQPLGGVRAALRVAEAHGLPCVVSSALETSVGIAAGVALAAALPELPFACGLATVALFTADVTSTPLLPVDGVLPVTRPSPDRLAGVAADPGTAARWLTRLDAVRAA